VRLRAIDGAADQGSRGHPRPTAEAPPLSRGLRRGFRDPLITPSDEGYDPRAGKSALQAAAVVGRRFSSGAVAELVGMEEPDLAGLVRRDFIRPLDGQAGVADVDFAFRHALTRDVAYHSLPMARRARLHAAYAEHLERARGGRDEDAPVLAHHYAEAVRPDESSLVWEADQTESARLRERARAWLGRSADLAVARYAIDETIALLERLLTLDPSPPEQSRTWLAIARANMLRYDGVGFWTAMERAIEVAPDPAARASILAELAFETAFRWAIWNRMPARELVDGWLDEALQLAEAGSRSRAVALVARAYWHPLDSHAAAVEAVSIAEGLDDVTLRSHALDAGH
jgi:hypothetical protein